MPERTALVDTTTHWYDNYYAWTHFTIHTTKIYKFYGLENVFDITYCVAASFMGIEQDERETRRQA